ncbi:MAG: MoaD/ThiS family protein [Acidimicrobiales bacterium]
MARLLLLGPAREAAGVARDDFAAISVGAVLDAAIERYGPGFADVVAMSRVWVNGEPADLADRVGAYDEVAVVPPVSGG